MTAISPSRASTHRPMLRWQRASWEDYVRIRDYHEHSEPSRVKLFFYKDSLLVDDMGWEGINHATVRGLFAYLLFCWFTQQPRRKARSFDGCLFEKDGKGAGSPDLVVYVGDGYPQWQKGESRKIDLNKWRVPDLVGEVSDTTLASDLDNKKQLYASLGIAEYWVVDVAGCRAFLFCLDEMGQYQEMNESKLLDGATSDLLSQAIRKLDEMSNMDAANWCYQQSLDPDAQEADFN